MANVTVTVLEADGVTSTDVELLGVGRQAAAASKSTAMSTEDKSQLDAAVTALQLIDNVVLAEDAAHSSGDVGVMALAVRKDTSSTGIGANGDYVPLAVDANGHLYVTINPAQLDGSEYETVAASQTGQVLGATGASGDYISKVVVIPATTSPGNVILIDNATSITIFTGGASSVSNLVPFVIDLGMTSVSGAWKLTTGANVSAIGIGNFT